MKTMNLFENNNPIKNIDNLLFAEEVFVVKTSGYYDQEDDTWSDRNFEAVFSKKHNEDM